MSEEIIRLYNIKKYYDGNTRVLENLNLIINKGAWTSIMGPSGSGKTTLLNIIGCLDSATAGSVSINGTEISKLNQIQLTRFPQRRGRAEFYAEYSLQTCALLRERKFTGDGPTPP